MIRKPSLIFRITIMALCWATHAEAFALNTTNRIIIKYHENTDSDRRSIMSASQVDQVRTISGIEISPLRRMGTDAVVATLPDWTSVDEVREITNQIAADPTVAYAEPDYRKQPMLVPTDTRYFEQWALFESTGGMRVQEAWDTTRGDPDIIVGIVDTGILPHSDLNTARIVQGFDFIRDIPSANDGNARDADPSDPGDGVLAGECPDPAQADSSWHGTHISGVIAAETDNNAGIAGIAHIGRILMARALGKCGGFTSDVVDGMLWAAGFAVAGVPANANPVRVVNLSLGGLNACTTTEQSAINSITDAGIVVVAAAGNESTDASFSAPANCNNVIAVASTTRSGGLTSISNTGATVDISAPGGEFTGGAILSTFNTGLTAPGLESFRSVLGTSVATAHVSGVIALMLAANDQLSPAQVLDILQITARAFPDPSCSVFLCGAGIVDATAAIAQALATVGAGFTPPGGGAVLGGGGGGGGGGGCQLVDHAQFDPTLLVYLTFALGWLIRRRAL